MATIIVLETLMQRDLTPQQLHDMLQLREQIDSQLGEDNSGLVVKWVLELYSAGVPMDYWYLDLDELKTDSIAKRTVELYLKNLHTAIQKGLGIAFLGDTGVGKTSLMCEIGKAALLEGYDVCYTTLESYLKALAERDKNVEAKSLYERVWDSKLIILDEIDKAYIKTGSDWVRASFVNLIKGTTPYGKALLTGMNCDEDSVSRVYGKAVYSAILRKSKFLMVEGADYGETIQQNWEKSLTDKPTDGLGTIPKYFIEQAELAEKLRQERLREQYDEVL